MSSNVAMAYLCVLVLLDGLSDTVSEDSAGYDGDQQELLQIKSIVGQDSVSQPFAQFTWLAPMGRNQTLRQHVPLANFNVPPDAEDVPVPTTMLHSVFENNKIGDVTDVGHCNPARLVGQTWSSAKRIRTTTAPAFDMVVVNPAFDTVISKFLIDTGKWDAHVLSALEHILRLKPCGPEDAVLDIGANLGFFGLVAAHTGCRVVAFEMQDVMRAHINSSLCLYGNVLGDRFTMIDAPVSEYPGDILNIPKTRGGNVGGLSVNSGCDDNPDSCIQAKATRVDMEVEKMDIKSVRFVKLDVEGFEWHALMSASKLFQQGKVENIVLEFVPKNLGVETGNGLLHFLRANGMSLFVLPFTKGDTKHRWPAVRAEPVLDIDAFTAWVLAKHDHRGVGMVDILATTSPQLFGDEMNGGVIPAAAPGT